MLLFHDFNSQIYWRTGVTILLRWANDCVYYLHKNWGTRLILEESTGNKELAVAKGARQKTSMFMEMPQSSDRARTTSTGQHRHGFNLPTTKAPEALPTTCSSSKNHQSVLLTPAHKTREDLTLKVARLPSPIQTVRPHAARWRTNHELEALESWTALVVY